MQIRRLTLFAGHYGSGKTNIAVNYAMMLRGLRKTVVVADLDIVNPYYRAKDSEDILSRAGIRMISSRFANSNLDLPAMPGEIYSLVCRTDVYGVLDIGGDDRGALALGRFAPDILAGNDYEMLLVCNAARPLTRTAADTVSVMREMEQASGIGFTGIVNNTNLGPDTSEEDILGSMPYIKEVSRMTGLPVKMTCARRDLAERIADRVEMIEAGGDVTVIRFTDVKFT